MITNLSIHWHNIDIERKTLFKPIIITDNGSNSPVQISTRSISPSIANSNSQIQSILQPIQQQQQVVSPQQLTPSHLLVNNLVNLGTPTSTHTQLVLKRKKFQTDFNEINGKSFLESNNKFQVITNKRSTYW